MNRDNWNGRPVKIVEFSIRDGHAVIEAFQRDGEEGSYALLVHGLRYADDNGPVFTSTDEVFDQPFRLRERISYFAAKCAFANGLRPDDPDAVVADEAPPNGHAAGADAGPSH